jgi:periplasmic protein TonB
MSLERRLSSAPVMTRFRIASDGEAMKTHTTIENELKASRAIPQRLHLEGMPSTGAIHQKDLLADSLLETFGEQRARRTSATVFSLLFQCSLVCVLLLIPLLFTEVLPRQKLMTFLAAPPSPPPPPPPAAPQAASRKLVKVASDISNGQLRTPTRVPKEVQIIKDDDAPPPVMATGGVVGGEPGGIPGGQMGGVIGGIISSTSSLAAVPKLGPKVVTPIQRVRISQGMTKGLLTYRIEPSYPTVAREARIHGEVVLTALIDKDGNIENLQVVSGHPMLAAAEINAVKQCRYKPYLLNGQPVEVETTITVNFELRA